MTTFKSLLAVLALVTYSTALSAQTPRESESIAINATCTATATLIEAAAEILARRDPEDMPVARALINTIARIAETPAGEIASIIVSKVASGETPQEIQATFLNACRVDTPT